MRPTSQLLCKQNYFLKRLFHTNIYFKYFLSFWNIKTGKKWREINRKKRTFPWFFILTAKQYVLQNILESLRHHSESWLSKDRSGCPAFSTLFVQHSRKTYIPWRWLRGSLGKTRSLSLLLSLSTCPSSRFPTKASESLPFVSQSARAATAKCQRLKRLNNRILFLAALETKKAKFKVSGENAPHGS